MADARILRVSRKMVTYCYLTTNPVDEVASNQPELKPGWWWLDAPLRIGNRERTAGTIIDVVSIEGRAAVVIVDDEQWSMDSARLAGAALSWAGS